jgi:hypothetical protein
MKPYSRLLLASAALISFAIVTPAGAETVTTKTVVSQKDVPNVEKTDFSAFDLNHDNVLTMREVGKKLFYVFDNDGNEVIDNIEFQNKKVMTIIPMEKQTFTFMDYDSDGNSDQSTFTYETFIQQSHLMRFDTDMDGLSPAEFIGFSFLETDDDNSKAVELEEWEEAYSLLTRPKAAEQERYN